MKWRLVVTRPFHLHGHFLPDYRAGSRGDYLPTGIDSIYVHSFCFRQPPWSQTLLHRACPRPPGGAGGATLHVTSMAPQPAVWRLSHDSSWSLFSPLTSWFCASSWRILDSHVSGSFRSQTLAVNVYFFSAERFLEQTLADHTSVVCRFYSNKPF